MFMLLLKVAIIQADLADLLSNFLAAEARGIRPGHASPYIGLQLLFMNHHMIFNHLLTIMLLNWSHSRQRLVQIDLLYLRSCLVVNVRFIWGDEMIKSWLPLASRSTTD